MDDSSFFCKHNTMHLSIVFIELSSLNIVIFMNDVCHVNAPLNISKRCSRSFFCYFHFFYSVTESVSGVDVELVGRLFAKVYRMYAKTQSHPWRALK